MSIEHIQNLLSKSNRETKEFFDEVRSFLLNEKGLEEHNTKNGVAYSSKDSNKTFITFYFFQKSLRIHLTNKYFTYLNIENQSDLIKGSYTFRDTHYEGSFDSTREGRDRLFRVFSNYSFGIDTFSKETLIEIITEYGFVSLLSDRKAHASRYCNSKADVIYLTDTKEVSIVLDSNYIEYKDNYYEKIITSKYYNTDLIGCKKEIHLSGKTFYGYKVNISCRDEIIKLLTLLCENKRHELINLIYALNNKKGKNRTISIKQAVIKVLSESSDELTIEEIYRKIIDNQLYDFGAEDPIGVVRVTIARACRNSNYSRKQKEMFFVREKGNKKLYSLLDNNSNDSNNVSEALNNSMISDEEKENIKTICVDKYSNGFRLNSPIEISRFKNRYIDEYGDINLSDDNVQLFIKSLGFIIENRVYFPDALLSNENKQLLSNYINSKFTKGTKKLYFDTVFSELPSQILNTLFSVELLKAYLLNVFNKDYIFYDNFFASEEVEEDDLESEIEKFLLSCSSIVNLEIIFEKFCDYPVKNIMKAISRSNKILKVGNNQYFVIDIFVLSSNEYERIDYFISDTLTRDGFCSIRKLLEEIKENIGTVIENNDYLGNECIKKSLLYYIKQKYSVNNNSIITEKDVFLSFSKLFVKFTRDHFCFSIYDLENFKEEVGTSVLYIDEVCKNSIRVSKEEFISISSLKFDVKKIDNVIDQFCNGDYISIYEIRSFVSFPKMQYQWNGYLLRSYVDLFSDKYKFIDKGANKSNYCGAIVKKASNILDVDDLCARIIKDNLLSKDKSTIGNYLVNKGYFATKQIGNFENIIKKI